MKDSKQMELIPLTSSQEDIHANHSRLQENKRVLKIRDTCGHSILGLSKNVGRLGLLEKMLVDTLNSVSTPLSRTWKVKITPSDHLVFQLRASAPTTKEKESGLWLTPSATTISTRSKESMEKRKKYRESIGRTTVPPGNLAEQIQYGKPTTEMWRTPDAHSGRGPSSEKRMKMKLEKGMPISINDQVAHPHLMWPTPSQRDYKGGSGTIKEKDGKYYRQSNKTGTKYGVRLDALIEYQHKKMWPTPRTGGGSRPNQKGGKVLNEEVLIAEGLRERGKTLKEMKTWPTPRASAAMNENLHTVKKRIDRRGKLGGKLEEEMAIAMIPSTTTWPTPSANEDAAGRPGGKMQKMLGNHPQVRGTGGGTLNPTWVEWLMGYPNGWTDLNHSEIVSSPKSPTTSDPSSSKRWRTPTAIDGGENAGKYAARILSGKNKRSSKHKVQETLSMQVAMEDLKDQPEKVKEILLEEMTTRPDLPTQQEFVEYLHSQITPKELSEKSGIEYTTVEHWFRRGDYFSHPSIKDWNHIKQFLKEIKFDEELNKTKSIEWKN